MILGTHPNLVDNIHYRSLADPWVIAFAMANNAVVVTKEYPVGNGSKKIRIPDVCEYYKIPWMDDFTFLPDIGFSY